MPTVSMYSSEPNALETLCASFVVLCWTHFLKVHHTHAWATQSNSAGTAKWRPCMGFLHGPEQVMISGGPVLATVDMNDQTSDASERWSNSIGAGLSWGSGHTFTVAVIVWRPIGLGLLSDASYNPSGVRPYISTARTGPQ